MPSIPAPDLAPIPHETPAAYLSRVEIPHGEVFWLVRAGAVPYAHLRNEFEAPTHRWVWRLTSGEREIGRWHLALDEGVVPTAREIRSEARAALGVGQLESLAIAAPTRRTLGRRIERREEWSELDYVERVLATPRTEERYHLYLAPDSPQERWPIAAVSGGLPRGSQRGWVTLGWDGNPRSWDVRRPAHMRQACSWLIEVVRARLALDPQIPLVFVVWHPTIADQAERLADATPEREEAFIVSTTAES